MNYTIRLASNKDIEQLIKISQEVTDYNIRQYLPDGMIKEFYNKEELKREITDSISTLKILVKENEIVGMINFTAHFLDILMIQPKYQGTDAGYYLLNSQCEIVFKEYKEIFLEVFNTNIHSRKFFQRFGFEKYDEEVIPGVVVKISKYKMYNNKKYQH
jgi:N-acetylglutamate synthase-like GNAT family acetyltransferase